MNKVKLLGWLREIKESVESSEEEFESVGICSAIYIISNEELNVCKKGTLLCHYETWKYYSGEPKFPVPSTIEYLAPREAYYSEYNKWQGEYGALRRDLLNHVIEQLERELM